MATRRDPSRTLPLSKMLERWVDLHPRLVARGALPRLKVGWLLRHGMTWREMLDFCAEGVLLWLTSSDREAQGIPPDEVIVCNLERLRAWDAERALRQPSAPGRLA